ncbi:MAG: hypothetical protein QOF99_1980, partial [Pseudonocardiales bacterium]|nr:hypothetical protein [Pseudonocardiales bacterium]
MRSSSRSTGARGVSSRVALISLPDLSGNY